MSVPDWWEAIILSLAAWRIFHLLAFDDILDRPRRYVTRLAPTWEKEGDATGDRYREGLGGFIECPFCLGFWIALGMWGAWQMWPHETLVFSAPWVLSALVVAGQKFLSADE